MSDTAKVPQRVAVGTQHLRLMGYLPAVVIFACVLAILLIIPAAAYVGRDYGFFTRDPTQLGKIPRYAGYLSSLGVMAWTAGASISFFSSAVLFLLSADLFRAKFFLFFGSFTALLAGDDLFLIHENFFFGEKAVFLGYGLIALTGLVLFRSVFNNSAAGFAKLAVAAFLLSLMIDAAQRLMNGPMGDFRILTEDGAKFFGVVCWAIFLCKFGASSILEAFHERSVR
ncbi:hypothetical protein [Limimaricola soesokkakensis]|uniref:hypothetical protein n=1 Tax=Limimaricola soesokkakensis TaxID=1343159 RepID=UPI003517B861